MHWTGKIDPIAFTIGKVSVAWYGIFITFAMVLALIICINRVKRINVKSDDMLVLFLIAIPMAIIFARLGYVVANYKDFFVTPYDWDAFVNTIAIWHGGLTIMWGVPGGVLGGVIWAKIYKKDVIKVADIVLPVVLLAQALGRWGNFFNQELYGQPVTNPNAQWFPIAVFIAREGEWRQACFFYEMIINIFGFLLLSYLVRRLDIKWFGTISYFTWYCLVRGIMETIRSEESVVDKQLGFNGVMVLSFCVAAIGLGLLIFLIVRRVKKGGKVFYKKGIPPLPPEEPKKAETLDLK